MLTRTPHVLDGLHELIHARILGATTRPADEVAIAPVSQPARGPTKRLISMLRLRPSLAIWSSSSSVSNMTPLPWLTRWIGTSSASAVS